MYKAYDKTTERLELVDSDSDKRSLIERVKNLKGFYSIYGDQEGYIIYVVDGELLDDWSPKDQEKINEAKAKYLLTSAN